MLMEFTRILSTKMKVPCSYDWMRLKIMAPQTKMGTLYHCFGTPDH
jgi:hypothetical protein